MIADIVSISLLKKVPPNGLSRGQARCFAADFYNTSKFCFGYKPITTGIAYNTSDTTRPEHWTDRSQSAYANGLIMPS